MLLVVSLVFLLPLEARAESCLVQPRVAWPGVAAPPVFGDFRSITKYLQLQLGNPRRMGQMAILGIILALFILMRK
jgi:hypothetical protein